MCKDTHNILLGTQNVSRAFLQLLSPNTTPPPKKKNSVIDSYLSWFHQQPINNQCGPQSLFALSIDEPWSPADLGQENKHQENTREFQTPLLVPDPWRNVTHQRRRIPRAGFRGHGWKSKVFEFDYTVSWRCTNPTQQLDHRKKAGVEVTEDSKVRIHIWWANLQKVGKSFFLVRVLYKWKHICNTPGSVPTYSRHLPNKYTGNCGARLYCCMLHEPLVGSQLLSLEIVTQKLY